jgi:hypothetical protein
VNCRHRLGLVWLAASLLAGCAASAAQSQRQPAPVPPPPADRAGDSYLPSQEQRCRRAWDAMIERQKQQEGGAEAFLDRCQRLALVAQCGDGWIEYGDNWRGCRDHGGLRGYFLIPDG